jgi:probable HAF family extracellular repeat protein
MKALSKDDVVAVFPIVRRAVFIFLVCIAGSTAARAQYFIRALDPLPGAAGSSGQEINNAGQVAGGSNNHAILWNADGSITDIGILPGASISGGIGISQSGQVAGQAITSAGFARAFFWSTGSGMIDLGVLPGGSLHSSGEGVNDLGQVVGTSRFPTCFLCPPPNRAFLWSAGTGMINLGTLGGIASEGTDINNSGQAVGFAGTTAGPSHAFLWTAGTGMTDLGTLPGATSSFAFSISNSGLVVGSANTASEPNLRHAFIWSAGDGIVDLGTLYPGQHTEAFDVNDSGQVVGGANDPTSNGTAFLYTADDGMLDLNTVAPAGWRILNALGINNKGQITGTGTLNGNFRAFVLWNPVPALNSLSSTINGLNLPNGVAKKLKGNIETAVDFLNAEDAPGARAALSDLIHDTNAQSGKKLTATQAAAIINVATEIRFHLGG